MCTFVFVFYFFFGFVLFCYLLHQNSILTPTLSGMAAILCKSADELGTSFGCVCVNPGFLFVCFV